MTDLDRKTLITEYFVKLAEGCEDDNVLCIVEKLKKLGVKGDHSAYSCPLAKAAKKELPLEEADYVYIGVFGAGWYHDGVEYYTRNFPKVCSRFVQTFDSYSFQDDHETIPEWYNELYED